MGVLYCLGWPGVPGSPGPRGFLVPSGVARGGPGSKASMCVEQTEVWEKEELRAPLSSRVPRVPGPALVLGLRLGATRLPLVSRAGSWPTAAPCREREDRLEPQRPALLPRLGTRVSAAYRPCPPPAAPGMEGKALWGMGTWVPTEAGTHWDRRQSSERKAKPRLFPKSGRGARGMAGPHHPVHTETPH